MSHLLCVGLGYSAERVAARLAGDGWQVTGSSRSDAGCARVRSLGYRAARFDGAAASTELRSALQETTHLLISAAPDAEDDPLLRWHLADIQNGPQLCWIGYLSTVGVYGDHQGAWVDETTIPAPITERGRRRVEAEKQWLALSTTFHGNATAVAPPPASWGRVGEGGGSLDLSEPPATFTPHPVPPHVVPEARLRHDGEGTPWLDPSSTDRFRPLTVQVFRLAGIYGPGQNQLAALRRGEARRIVKAGQVFNRIHVDDIAGAVIAGIRHPEAAGLFNVADDLPAPPDEVIVYAAGLLGIAPPPVLPFETAELSPMAKSFYGEVKRVSNARLKTDLGWQPLYPTYREGLAALAER